ncbi:MAG: mannonate dehydratase, partial [Chloroflexi bacterium]|nr:mannonate dehydratase [Chloroflexota bacterium]
MKLVLGVRSGHDRDDSLRFAAQLGVDGVMTGPGRDDTPNGYYEYPWLVSLKSHAEAYGLTLEAMSLLPWHLCYKWMLGLPGRDEQIENTLTSIRNMGAAGVPIMVFNMHALRFYRTSNAVPDRAGALATGFEYERVKNAPLMTTGHGADMRLIPPEQRRRISDEEMWANYTYFIKAAAPVAEEAGVKLALHPDDPQVPEIAGVARIMRSPEAFRRALEIADSPALGLKFCTGCFSQMGADVEKEIRYFGGLGK